MIDHNDPIWQQRVDEQLRDTIDQHPLKNNGGYSSLIQAVAAEARKAAPDDQYSYLKQGLEVVEKIMRAVNEDDWNLLDEECPKTEKAYWYHRNYVSLVGKKRREPYISLNGTQQAAATYLSLPYRVPALDRILVDMLVASEMFAFVDDRQPVLKKQLPPPLRWLLNNILGLIIGFSLAAFCFWIGDGNTAMNWVGGIILAVTLLDRAWSLISFPYYYSKSRAQNRRVEEVIGAMLDAYFALAGSPASTNHIDALLAKATDKGVVWPSQLMVLMEDIRARSATI